MKGLEYSGYKPDLKGFEYPSYKPDQKVPWSVCNVHQLLSLAFLHLMLEISTLPNELIVSHKNMIFDYFIAYFTYH